MIERKLDIFNSEWLEVVFEGRNRQYGAYVLRQLAPRATNMALAVATSAFLIGVVAPKVSGWLNGDNKDLVETPALVEQEVTLAEPPPVNEEEPQLPPPAEPPPPRRDQVRMPEMAVTPAEMVHDEEPPTVETLKLADPGTQTIAGDPNAVIRIDMPVGEGKLDSEATGAGGPGGNGDSDFNSVEIQPIPYEGSTAAFGKWVGERFQIPQAALDAGIEGTLLIGFVIDKNGKIVDIKVEKDLGFGTAQEAIRVLKTSRPWKPGVQNGRAVRVTYTLPIRIGQSRQ